MARGKDWTEDEDVSLVQAWLTVSEDATKGTEQKGETFWAHVFEIYKLKYKERKGLSDDDAKKFEWRTEQGLHGL